MNRRLVTEAALATARRLLAAFPDRFPAADWPAAFETCFDVVRAGIEGYAAAEERLRRQLPGSRPATPGEPAAGGPRNWCRRPAGRR